MLRLPDFTFRRPHGDVAEAAAILAGEGPRAMLVAAFAGTDLWPKMKRTTNGTEGRHRLLRQLAVKCML